MTRKPVSHLAPRPLSDAALERAGQMLRVLVAEPMTDLDRIDALAALCNAALGMRRYWPDIYARSTLPSSPGAS